MPQPVRRRKAIGEPCGRIYLGIDPGKTGGLATISQGGIVISFEKMPPSVLDLWRLLARMRGIHVAYLEKVNAFAGEAAKASWTFGRGYGHLEMALTAADIGYKDAPPKDWQKALKIPPRKKKGRKFVETQPAFKERLRATCQKMFPKLTLWDEALGMQRACCDAILIAEYGRLHDGSG